ncbi:hypothetical protein [Frankia sp. AvcI1]|uniref:hypothetical protein n=1 Tax=Frankia sp. AvcI1 TaxID=573496 RepID=UPI0021194F51|nr:hypothetical protein [Frankia sp. AvcI1]
MKYRTRTVQVPGVHVVDGIPAPVIRTEQVQEPIPPRDWDATALRAVTTLVVLLTLISVAWSTASIAHLLGAGPIGYLAATVFDAAWITALGMTYLVRHRPDRRSTVDRLGWTLVAVTVTAIGVEGWQTGGAATACAGAAVSLIAKGLWWALGRATRPSLSDLDSQWLAARLSALAAQRAAVAMQRQVVREQARLGEFAAGTRPAGPTPALDPGPTRPDPRPGGGVDPGPEVEPAPAPQQATVAPATESTPAPRPAGRPALHAVPDQVDPARLAQARAIVAELRAEGIEPSTEQIRKRMRIKRDRVRVLWLAIQAEEAAEQTRTA